MGLNNGADYREPKPAAPPAAGGVPTAEALEGPLGDRRIEPPAYSYGWSRNGTDIAGATSNTLSPDSAGQYRCRATAQNRSGSTSQVSPPKPIFAVGKTKLDKKKGTATIPVDVPGPGTLALSGKDIASQRPLRARHDKPVSGAGTVKLTVKAKGKAKKKLKKKGKVKVKVTITFAPTGGEAASQVKSVKLRKKR